MAITGQLVSGTAQFRTGAVDLQFAVEIHDDQLGFLGAKGYQVTDPAVTAAVLQFVEELLPTMSQQIGIPVTLPAAPEVP